MHSKGWGKGREADSVFISLNLRLHCKNISGTSASIAEKSLVKSRRLKIKVKKKQTKKIAQTTKTPKKTKSKKQTRTQAPQKKTFRPKRLNETKVENARFAKKISAAEKEAQLLEKADLRASISFTLKPLAVKEKIFRV